MAQVFKVMVRCPVTHQEFDTGIRTSGREVLASNVYQNGIADCFHCHQFHPLEGNAYLVPESTSRADSLWRPNP